MRHVVEECFSPCSEVPQQELVVVLGYDTWDDVSHIECPQIVTLVLEDLETVLRAPDNLAKILEGERDGDTTRRSVHVDEVFASLDVHELSLELELVLVDTVLYPSRWDQLLDPFLHLGEQEVVERNELAVE